MIGSLVFIAAAVAATFGLQLAGPRPMDPTTTATQASRYAEDISGVTLGEASPSQREANSALLNAYLARGSIVRLRPGARLEIGRSLVVASGGGIVGDEGGPRPVIFMPASAFDNRNDVAGEGRYGLNAVGIRFSGQLSGDFEPSRGVRIENLSLVSERKPGRRLRGIVGQNVADCTIRNVEISGFPMGIGIALASASRCNVTAVHVRDFYDDVAWQLLPQSTGIEIDNDIVAGRATSDTVVERFKVERLLVGGPLLAKWGYQTDGVNIMHPGARVTIRDGSISDVGEGIDTFGSAGTIANVRISNTYIFGLKFVHGASHNRVRNVEIVNAGLAGVTFSGSDIASQDTAGNVIEGLKIRYIDFEGRWKANSSAGVLVSGKNARRVPVDNRVIGAVIELGPRGKYGWLDQSTGRGNIGMDIEIRGGASLDRPALILYGGGRVAFRALPSLAP